MSIVYQVRSGALSGFLPLVGSLQGDADGLLAVVGLDREVLANPDRLIGIEQLASLLDNCAKCLECPDFGLRLAGYQGIDMLGVLGRVLLTAPTLGAAFNAAQRFMALHNKAEHWRMREEGGLVCLHRIEHFYAIDNPRQYREMALGACCRLVRAFGGEAIRPLRAEFVHQPLAPLSRYRQFFGCEVLFNQEFDRLVYDPSVLQRPLLPPDGQLLAQVDDYVRDLLSRCEENLELQVRTLVSQTLGLQQHSLAHIAALLGLHPRTLQRRLLAENLQFKALVQDVKMKTASWYLSASSLEITQLADMLGYADIAAFSKAFRLSQGVSPSQWRAVHGVSKPVI
ncbi:MAG TPA: AraC family transcriptional regulator [Pseudomonas sp.]|uniref:AraC family transcriptional regulator n=1 Tax=Pseudomonas sp. TaxID=306 RepID=UPI002C642DA9|nr:AraC family transcriptional regulator [Pseudomonas sp.]HRL94277.1 AraC family transcriptional regulator [Pseudomonas sp.]